MDRKEIIIKNVIPECINFAFSMIPGFGGIASSFFNAYLNFKNEEEFKEKFNNLSEEVKAEVIEKTKEICLEYIQKDKLDISINRIELELKTDEFVEDCVNEMKYIIDNDGFLDNEVNLGPVDVIYFVDNRILVNYLYDIDKQDALEYATGIIKVINTVCDSDWSSQVKDVRFD